MSAEKRCIEKDCKNMAARHSRYCNACRTRRWRAKNKLRAAYLIHKHNAIRRGKPYELTFEQFIKFCEETNYLEIKGRLKGMYHCDRVRSGEGYHEGNIQVLEASQNFSKQDNDDWKPIDTDINF